MVDIYLIRVLRNNSAIKSDVFSLSREPSPNSSVDPPSGEGRGEGNDAKDLDQEDKLFPHPSPLPE